MSQPSTTPPRIPPPTPTFPMDTDNQIIIASLEDIKLFLHHCIDNILPVAILDGFEDRIVHFQTQLSFIDSNIDNSKQTISNTLPLNLDLVGMSGSQLRELKVPILRSCLQTAYKYSNRSHTRIRTVIRWIKRALNAINPFLGSLKTLAPPLEIVKEFKEQIENVI